MFLSISEPLMMEVTRFILSNDTKEAQKDTNCSLHTEQNSFEKPGKEEQSGIDLESAIFEDEYADHGALLRSFSPLICSMQLIGCYFTSNTVKSINALNKISHPFPLTEFRLQHGVSQDKRWNFGRCYGAAILGYLWLNVVRLLSTFSSSDKFTTRFMFKLVAISHISLSAIVHMSYFIACNTGYLDSILRCLRVTKTVEKSVRKYATVVVAFAWLSVAMNCIMVALLMTFHYDKVNFLTAPFDSSMLSNRSYSIAVKIVVSAVVLLTFPPFLFPMATNQLLTYVLYKEFQQLNKRFQNSIQPNGHFDGDLKAFRLHHQALSRILNTADRFLMFSNASGFLVHVIVAIFLMYILVFQVFLDTMSIITGTGCLFFTEIGLTITLGNGILVNHSAHKLGVITHNIDVSELSLPEMNELLMFQKRLSGDAIGFSVLGIFVINKSTVLSLLSLLVTYFLLVIQLSLPQRNGSDLSIFNGTTTNNYYTPSWH